jgi:hypothetical protein
MLAMHMQPLPDLHPTPPSTNGKHPAPRSERGAVVHSSPRVPQPTRFPPALPGGGVDWLLFTLGRGTFLGFPLLRVIVFVVIFVAVLFMLRPQAGGWWAAALLLLMLALVALARMAAARRNFVHFREDAAGVREPGDGVVPAAPLPVEEKLPVYLWGNLDVHEKVRRFAALPAFYRTFATREHALIGHVVSMSKLGVAALPDLDAGLWYAFCRPEQLFDVRAGTVRWGQADWPALALIYRTERARPGGRKQSTLETLFVAARDGETVQRVLADLNVERRDTHAAERTAAVTRQ